MDRPTLYSISLTIKCQSAAVVLVKPLAALSKCFLGIGLLDFTEFWHVAGNPYENVHDKARVFVKNLSKNCGNGPKVFF